MSTDLYSLPPPLLNMLHGQMAGLPHPRWPLLLLFRLVSAQSESRTPRYIQADPTFIGFSFGHSSHTFMFLQLTLCDLHISVPTLRQVHENELWSVEATHTATARLPITHRRAPSPATNEVASVPLRKIAPYHQGNNTNMLSRSQSKTNDYRGRV